MTDPIIVIAVFEAHPGQRDQLVSALSGAMPAVHQEPGCLLYAIHHASDDTITMIEKWESVDFLNRHSSGDAVAELGKAIAPFMAKPVEVNRLSPIPAGDPRRGAL